MNSQSRLLLLDDSYFRASPQLEHLLKQMQSASISSTYSYRESEIALDISYAPAIWVGLLEQHERIAKILADPSYRSEPVAKRLQSAYDCSLEISLDLEADLL